MNDDLKINVSIQFMEVMEIASNISRNFFESKTTTLDIAIAALSVPDNNLIDFLENAGRHMESREVVDRILMREDLYEKIVGKSYDEYTVLHDMDGVSDYILVSYSDEVEEAFECAYCLCEAREQHFVDLNTFLFCIFKIEDSGANKLMKYFFKLTGIVRYLNKNILDCLENNYEKEEEQSSANLSESIKDFVTNMNSKYNSKSECDILGREKEIFKVWNIISKKTKRNAILIGKPGVGKSAIIEAITYSIVKKTCPKEFEKYTVYSLNVNGMVAGTKYRGEFEQRTEELIRFIKGTKNVIIFLDEIHHLLGAGNSEKSGSDLAGALKPLLARDNVIFIGATTIDEYNRIFKTDGALSRRFEVVMVKEPKISNLKPMIKGRVDTLSKYHNVNITDKMLDDVIINASSFSSIANPDRTIDLVDKSMAIAKMTGAKDLSMSHIKMVFQEHFDKYNKFPYNVKRTIAYHEAGHFIMWYLSKTQRNQNCLLVSIIPANDWQGVNIFEEKDTDTCLKGKQYFEDCISISLAGRIAQKMVTDELDSGASSDLTNATSIVEQYLMYYGIDDEFSNYSFDTYEHKKLPISDNVSDKIREKSKEIIKNIYESAEKVIDSNKVGLESVANLLMKKGIVTGQEAIKAFKKAQNSLKEKTIK